MKRYRGILFVTGEMVAKLGARGSGTIWDAHLHGDQVELQWSGGKKSSLSWKSACDEAGLGHLPTPTTAFGSAEGTAIGLLFESHTPMNGLQYQEPHSVIFPMGWLTTKGLQDRA